LRPWPESRRRSVHPNEAHAARPDGGSRVPCEPYILAGFDMNVFLATAATSTSSAIYPPIRQSCSSSGPCSASNLLGSEAERWAPLMSELPRAADDRPSLDRIGAKGVRYPELCPGAQRIGQTIGAFQNTRFKLGRFEVRSSGRMGLCRPVSARNMFAANSDFLDRKSYGPLRCTDGLVDQMPAESSAATAYARVRDLPPVCGCARAAHYGGTSGEISRFDLAQPLTHATDQ